jgi:hypothetical protein
MECCAGENGEWAPQLEPFSEYDDEEKRAKFYAGEKEYINALQREKAREGGMLFVTQQQDWHDCWCVRGCVCLYVRGCCGG